MQWEDTVLLGILLGNLPKVRRTRDEDKVEKQIWHLEKILKSYDAFTMGKESFVKEVNDVIDESEIVKVAKEKSLFLVLLL